MEFVKLTHPHPKVPEYVSIYSRALHAVLGGASVRQQAEHALRRLGAWDTCQGYSRQAARYRGPPKPVVIWSDLKKGNKMSAFVLQVCGGL